VIFGEVLFDAFPDGNVVLGGAPFNVAWHLQAFGAAPLFVSRVGDDPLGRRIRDTMQAWDMNTAGLQLDSAHPTGTVQVSFEDGEPNYQIVEDRAYDFVAADALPPLNATSLVYHGTLALRRTENQRTLEQVVERTGAPVFLDVNLRPPWWDPQRIPDLLRGARWVKLNEHELRALAPGGDSLEEQAAALQDAYALELLVLTLGAAGALIRTPQGETTRVAPEPALQVVDTVGAGDAFTAVTLFGLLQEWDLETLLRRAQAFASAVVGIRGATPAQRGFYAGLTAQWGAQR
jgi:fructokinase